MIELAVLKPLWSANRLPQSLGVSRSKAARA
jgi:hypothetical protein